MSLKSWVLSRVHRMNGLVSRTDLPEREPEFESTLPAIGDAAPRTPRGVRAAASREPALSSAEHLGAYAPLIGAIRDELDHFVASQVRLHLAIADHDRFVLTSIGVACADAETARPLLHQFLREFKPEQVKRYLAREVIGALPNAAAIDLSQFAGLFDADAHAAAEEAEGDEYRELLDALRIAPAAPPASRYRVSVLGRWVELDAARAAPAPTDRGATPSTPLAGQRCEFDVEDGGGRRRVVLQGVVAGRRYVVGNGEGCDLRVDGTFTSRRHAELWLEKGAWWVADAGSTNGLRIEPHTGLLDPSRAPTVVVEGEPARLGDGLRVVLSARAEGAPGDYPWLALRQPARAASLVTPIAAPTSLASPRTAILAARLGAALPSTPTTEILAARSGAGAAMTSPTEVLPRPAAEAALRLTVAQAAGLRTVVLAPAALPVSIGRSRNQTLVVDRRHDGVSGHHLDIVALDDAGASVVVHGDNGVLVEGVRHDAGARLHWPIGATMLLGASPGEAAGEVPACSLVLTRPSEG